ncbi:queuosine precursor transporter [Staphylococcus aureus]
MSCLLLLATDILNDIYGRRVAKRAILVRLFININYDYCYAIVITFYLLHRNYVKNTTIFDVVPRIALGSIVAYIIGQHIDVFIFSLIKKVFSSDKTLLIRAYGSKLSKLNN